MECFLSELALVYANVVVSTEIEAEFTLESRDVRRMYKAINPTDIPIDLRASRRK